MAPLKHKKHINDLHHKTNTKEGVNCSKSSLLHTRRRNKSNEYEKIKEEREKKGGKNKEENKDNVMHLETGQRLVSLHSRIM